MTTYSYNPLIPKVQVSMIIDDTEIFIDRNNILDYCKKLYVLVPLYIDDKNNILVSYDDKLYDTMILYQCSVNMLAVECHYNSMVYIDSTIVSKANKFNYDLDEYIFVIPFSNISFLNIQRYIDYFETKNNLENLYNRIVLCQNFKNNYNMDRLVWKMIQFITECDYWTKEKNCQLNMTRLFEKRLFNIENLKRNKDDEIMKFIKQLENIKIDDNYLNKITKKKKYVDPSTILYNNFKLYSIPTKCKFTQSDINNLFAQLSKDNQIYLFLKLLISKQYCHLVLNNKEMLTNMEKYIINFKNNDHVGGLIGYAWSCFYYEESIKNSYCNTTDRFIFNADTAALLPTYNYGNMYNNSPYLPVNIENNVLKQLNGVEFTTSNNDGICCLNDFRKRFNVYCTGNSNNNLFENVDFKKLKMAISGSIMPACMKKNHTLLKLFEPKNSFDDLYNRFFAEYYCESDIDIMIKTQDDEEFINICNELYENIYTNLKKFYETVSKEYIKLEFIKRIYCNVSDDFIKENFTNYDYIVNNLKEPEVIELFKPHIEKNYKLLNEKNDNIDNYYITIRIINNEQDNRDIYLLSNIKTKISSLYMDHKLEIFPIVGDDFFASVNKFHLPCVRAYYDGEDVYMTPSFISAMLTNVNINYKYVAATTTPMEIINKYRMRGFGIFLNKNELLLLAKYSSSVEFWKILYQYDKHTNINITKLNINDIFYKPRLYCNKYYEKLTGIKYIDISENNMYKSVKSSNTRYNDKIKPYICKNGFHIPLKHNEIDEIAKIVNKNNY